jgi:hypothetical protein
MGLFSSFKDNLSSFSGEQIIKGAVERYGELLDFKLNSTAKSIYIKLLPKGEKEPVEVNVNRYEVIEQSGKLFIHIHDIKASREWISLLAKDYVIKNRIEVPGNYASIVRKFI